MPLMIRNTHRASRRVYVDFEDNAQADLFYRWLCSTGSYGVAKALLTAGSDGLLHLSDEEWKNLSGITLSEVDD
jgi:hypothetical protein